MPKFLFIGGHSHGQWYSITQPPKRIPMLVPRKVMFIEGHPDGPAQGNSVEVYELQSSTTYVLETLSMDEANRLFREYDRSQL